MSKSVAPYGCWDSPIGAKQVAARTIAYDDVRIDGEALYWLESRPQEEGRTALVRWAPDAGKTEVLPPAFDVGSRVHEYGGGAYFVGGGVFVASNLLTTGSTELLRAAVRSRSRPSPSHREATGMPISESSEVGSSWSACASATS
ncbi:MAG: hypothetical protein QOH66_434 [Actinomycetota bacterium]|nr:hypothetical protein [Actinomycetota bacterium]